MRKMKYSSKNKRHLTFIIAVVFGICWNASIFAWVRLDCTGTDSRPGGAVSLVEVTGGDGGLGSTCTIKVTGGNDYKKVEFCICESKFGCGSCPTRSVAIKIATELDYQTKNSPGWESCANIVSTIQKKVDMGVSLPAPISKRDVLAKLACK